MFFYEKNKRKEEKSIDIYYNVYYNISIVGRGRKDYHMINEIKNKTDKQLLKEYFEKENKKNKLLIEMRLIKKELKERNI